MFWFYWITTLRETVDQIKSKEIKFKDESLDWDKTLWHLSSALLYAAAAVGTWKPPPLQEIQLFLQGPRFQSGWTNVWAQEGSHRLGGARSSHTHRICKDFNNEPLTPNHRDRSGVNKGLHICKFGRGAPIKAEPGRGSRHHTHSLWHLQDLQVTEQRCQHGEILFSGLAGPEPSQHGAGSGASSWHGFLTDLQTSRSLRGAAAPADSWQELPTA